MDMNKIEELIDVLEGSRTEELCLRKGDVSVCIRKGRKPKAVAARKPARPAGKTPEAPPEVPVDQLILAPMVGIFHPAGGVLSKGGAIQKGQVVGTIESMKLGNDVIAEISGTVAEVMIEDGSPVEYGQPICRVEP